MFMIPYATPEDVGLSSKSILRFINQLDQYHIPMHGILLARHGKIISEAYYAPYEAYTLHRMFSVSKSFTSIAIGLLIEEGQLSLDDPIINYFPDKLPKQVNPWIAQMTIRDMLRMQTCHSNTTFKIHSEQDWVESFFITEPDHQPGTIFRYDTSSSHTLCALVERLTGKSMLDYMRYRFLDEIDFSREAYMIKDPFGISMGGSGLMATPMDLMKFAMIITNGGKIDGKQILPEWYIQEAISHQTDTLVNGPTLEECQGYGYQFWRIEHNGYACYGMGGQLVICLPEQDLICITTADTQGIQGGNQLIYNSLYDEILPYLSNAPLPVNPSTQTELDTCIKNLAIQPLEGNIVTPLIANFQGQVFHLAKNQSGFTDLSISVSPTMNEGTLTITNNKGPHTLTFGLGKMAISQFPIYNQRCATSAIWLSKNTLYIRSHLIDTCIGSVHFQLTFIENTLTLYMKKLEETYFKEFAGFIHGSYVKSPC